MCGPSVATPGRGRVGELALARSHQVSFPSWLVSALCRVDFFGSGMSQKQRLQEKEYSN